MTDKEKQKHIDAFKYWCETNEECGVITIPKFVCDNIIKILDNAPKVEIPTGEWIPITYRPLTEEEVKELCAEWGIEELEEWEKRVFTCSLPDDGQEILISYWGKYVQEDICSWDEYGCGLENNGDWDGVDAWMPKPEPYKKGGVE